MKFWMKALMLVGLVFSTGCALEADPETETKFGIAQPDDTKATQVTVERVVDGDTIKVRLPDGKIEDVRFLLIDTPETVNPEKPVQPFGPEASSFTKDLLPKGSKIVIERDHSKTDRYGRLLAYVWIDGKMVNQELLRQGLARVAYVYEPDTRYVKTFEDIELEAKAAKKGIWETEGYATNRGFDETVLTKESTSSAKGQCEDIKGNINRQGNKIYHVKGGRSYEDVKPEEMFCSEQEAKQAGFRRAAN